MKVLFTYNARIECDEFGNFYGNEINNQVVDRYKLFGDDITFLVRKKRIQSVNSKGLTKLDKDALRIIFVPEFSSFFSFLKHISSVKKITKQVVYNSDIIIARTPSTLSRIAIKYAKLAGKPYLIEVVGCPLDALWNYSLLGKILAPYVYLKMKRVVKEAPFVIYVTNKFLQRRYPNNHEQVAISDVILVKTESNILEEKVRRLKDSLYQKNITLGTAGGIDIPYKGHILVLKAVAGLKKLGYTVHYRLAGKGSPDSVRNAAWDLNITDCVEICGEIPFREMPAFFDKLDIYVQPSLQEGLPRAMIEAMNRACPCIGTNIGGIPELLDGRFILNSRDPNELVNLISKTCSIDWIEQAKLNFYRAKEFYSEILNEKRVIFFSKFKELHNLT